MSSPSESAEKLCAIYVDMGTTNTRAWLMEGSRLVARETAPVGIRDSAREKSAKVIRSGLHDLIAQLRGSSVACTPTHIAAAGMITSSLGLTELSHVAAPAGLDELSSAAQWHHFGDISDLPILLVPGVRCGPASPKVEQIDSLDVMRGEETLCAGLVALNVVSRSEVVLNLGSHWKAIQLDEEGRVSSSITSLSGELIHATQQHTILAGSVATSWPDRLSAEWVKSGMDLARQSWLSRALFCARLINLSNQGTAEDRLAFVIGAFIASDLDALRNRGALSSQRQVGIIGSKALSEAWQFALSDAGIPSAIVDSATGENAFLSALRLILENARHLLDRSSAQNIRRNFRS
ncbi:MAG TPA: 2-dehydro-3-deoxygalactonokinase [Terriglobales bacterium]|nr:2-dehydro-3-deoxygalactonokinase [Terriglobales bacterium]